MQVSEANIKLSTHSVESDLNLLELMHFVTVVISLLFPLSEFVVEEFTSLFGLVELADGNVQLGFGMTKFILNDMISLLPFMDLSVKSSAFLLPNDNSVIEASALFFPLDDDGTVRAALELEFLNSFSVDHDCFNGSVVFVLHLVEFLFPHAAFVGHMVEFVLEG